MIDSGAACATAISVDIFPLGRNAAGGKIDSDQTPPALRLRMPEKTVVSDVGQRVADGAQLPVKHRNEAWLCRVEHGVLEPIIAMRDGYGLICWYQSGQLRNQLFHRGDGLGLGATILLDPPGYLAFEVAIRTAKICQAARHMVDLVQLGERGVELVIDRCTLAWRQTGKRGIAENASVHEVHHIERRADDRLVLA